MTLRSLREAQCASARQTARADRRFEVSLDSAIAMTLSLARGVHFLNSRLRRGEGPWHFLQAAPLHRVRGRVFGVVGLGRIGTAADRKSTRLNSSHRT